VLAGGCAGGPSFDPFPTESAPSLATRAGDLNQFLTLNSLAILPIAYDPKLRLVTDDVRAGAERGLEEAFRREVDVRFLSSADVKKVIGAPAGAGGDPASIGRRLNVDGVPATTENQLVERRGSAAGAEQPAAVDFTMRLVRSSNGAEIWRAVYHYKDEPLSENLLNLNARLAAGSVASFRSARDLLTTGFSSAGRDLAEARQGSFQR